jgi:hypothetical protein
MARNNDIYNIIVQAQSPVFSAHTYTEIYGGTDGCSVVINGTLVEVAPSSSLSIAIRTVSGGTGCYLLGDFNDVVLGSPNVG